jgi:hypothetical protein
MLSHGVGSKGGWLANAAQDAARYRVKQNTALLVQERYLQNAVPGSLGGHPFIYPSVQSANALNTVAQDFASIANVSDKNSSTVLRRFGKTGAQGIAIIGIIGLGGYVILESIPLVTKSVGSAVDSVLVLKAKLDPIVESLDKEDL